jgi:hypothetical protein
MVVRAETAPPASLAEILATQTSSLPAIQTTAAVTTLITTTDSNGATTTLNAVATPTGFTVVTNADGSVSTIALLPPLSGLTSQAPISSDASSSQPTDSNASSSSSAGGGGSLQDGSGGDGGLPRWGIALIAVFGVLLFLTLLALLGLLLRNHRRKQRKQAARASVASLDPEQQPASPSPNHPEMAALLRNSTISGSGSGGRASVQSSNAATISREEATALASAFRETLRQPTLPIAEGGSPASTEEGSSVRDSPTLPPQDRTPANTRTSVLNPFETTAERVMQAHLEREGQSMGEVASKRPHFVP